MKPLSFWFNQFHQASPHAVIFPSIKGASLALCNQVGSKIQASANQRSMGSFNKGRKNYYANQTKVKSKIYWRSCSYIRELREEACELAKEIKSISNQRTFSKRIIRKQIKLANWWVSGRFEERSGQKWFLKLLKKYKGWMWINFRLIIIVVFKSSQKKRMKSWNLSLCA